MVSGPAIGEWLERLYWFECVNSLGLLGVIKFTSYKLSLYTQYRWDNYCLECNREYIWVSFKWDWFDDKKKFWFMAWILIQFKKNEDKEEITKNNNKLLIEVWEINVHWQTPLSPCQLMFWMHNFFGVDKLKNSMKFRKFSSRNYLSLTFLLVLETRVFLNLFAAILLIVALYRIYFLSVAATDWLTPGVLGWSKTRSQCWSINQSQVFDHTINAPASSLCLW